MNQQIAQGKAAPAKAKQGYCYLQIKPVATMVGNRRSATPAVVATTMQKTLSRWLGRLLFLSRSIVIITTFHLGCPTTRNAPLTSWCQNTYQDTCSASCIAGTICKRVCLNGTKQSRSVPSTTSSRTAGRRTYSFGVTGSRPRGGSEGQLRTGPAGSFCLPVANSLLRTCQSLIPGLHLCGSITDAVAGPRASSPTSA